MSDVAKLITDDSFIADCCRFSEGILSEATVKHRWRKVVSETDWATMGSNDELVIVDEVCNVVHGVASLCVF